MKRPHILIFTVCTLLAACSACSQTGHRDNSDSLSQIRRSDSLPQPVKKLVVAVAASDTAAFARMVSYPLSRPYPLYDIDSPEAMMSYYPTLVDDSLHTVIASSTPGQWSKYGWRGWTLQEGQYLWLDGDDIYSINYISARERAMMDSLNSAEIASLEPALRGAWTPVTCLKATHGPQVFRIDLAKGHHTGPAYRMLVFASQADMRRSPSLILTGYLRTEGSAQIATYYFSASDGNKASYTPDTPDGSSEIDYTSPSGVEHSLEVAPAFWRELLQ